MNRVTSVSTVKSGSDYRATLEDGTTLRLTLDPDSDVVTAYTATAAVGGYRLARFGGELSPDSIRALFGHAPKRCREPKATPRVFNSGTGKGPQAYCTGCKKYKPAKQVPWGQEKRDSLGRITATYAPIAH